MKRFWIILLVVAVAIVMALPAGAVKPPKPPKPPTSVLIAVSIDAEPLWVHEDADIIRYHVTLENKTSELISDVSVEFTAALPVETWVVGDLQANGSKGMGFWRTVSQYDEAITCEVGDECPLSASAAVLVDGNPVTQTEMSTPLMPEPACGFKDYGTDWVSNSVTVSYLCIWTLPEDEEGITKTGVWEIALRPTLPDNTRKPLEARVDVRDGVPGNWCTLAIGDPWGFGDRWKAPYPDDLSVTGQVYLPGAEDHSTLGLDNGMCVSGGVGGDYFKVGNPKAFYFRANGDVTVKWVSATP